MLEENLTKMYNDYVSLFKESRCTITTSLEEFIKNGLNLKRSNHIKVNYIASCGHKHDITIKSFNVGYGKICKECSDKIIHSVTEGSSTSSLLEDKAIVYIKNLLKSDFEIRLTDDGCLADLAIKPLNQKEDKWLMLQIKSTNSKLNYRFGMNNNIYLNCVILCICLHDQKTWIFNGNCVINKSSLMIGKNNSKYDENEIKTPEDLISVLTNFMYILPSFCFDEINIPKSNCHKIEQEFRKIRDTNCNFLKFEYPDKTGLKYDFTINNKKFQEKVVQNNGGKNSFKVTMSNKNSYKIGDNDFYWFHFPDGMKFMILSEKILEKSGHLKTNTQLGKMVFCFNQTDERFSKYIFDYENPNKDVITTLIDH